mgnify:CR=1 FL=1
MAGGRFAKQASYKGGGSIYWNSNNAQDTVIGGGLTVSPVGSNIGSQGWQNFPGDRVILSPMDVVAFQNNNVGNLYTGTFRYVNLANSVTNPALGCPAFWVPVAFNNNQAAQDGLYQVTSDQLNNYGVSLFAGVFINNVPKASANVNSYWWIQECGKVRAQFDALAGLTSVAPAIGAPVYLNAAGNNNNQAFTQFDGGNSNATFAANSVTAYTVIGQLISRYVGVAEQLPSNNNISVIDLVFKNGGFRW